MVIGRISTSIIEKTIAKEQEYDCGGKIYSCAEMFDENSRRKYLRTKCHQNTLKTPLCSLRLLVYTHVFLQIVDKDKVYTGIKWRHSTGRNFLSPHSHASVFECMSV